MNRIVQGEISKELEEINLKRPVKHANKKTIEELYRDRSILFEEEFDPKGKKRDGVTGGYEAADEQGNLFILKNFFKSNKNCKTHRDRLERKDAVNEFMIAGIYRYLMMADGTEGRSPREHLVLGKNPDILYVRSKFFKDVRPFSALESTELPQVNGFAKGVAGFIVGGEADYHSDNNMVEDNEFKKIDHGRSFSEIYEDFSSFIKATNINFNHFGYNDDIKNFGLKFDITEFTDSLKQMVNSFNEEQIEDHINQKLSELKKTDFDPKGLSLDLRINNIESDWQARIKEKDRGEEYFMDRDSIEIESYQELGEYYKYYLNSSFKNSKAMIPCLEVIAKFSKAPEKFNLDKFKKGEWLNEIANFNCDNKDPVLFAAHNNILIEDKNPLIWAQENKHMINEYQLDEKIDELKIVKKSPLKYILEYKKISRQPLSYTEQEFISLENANNHAASNQKSNTNVLPKVAQLKTIFKNNQTGVVSSTNVSNKRLTVSCNISGRR